MAIPGRRGPNNLLGLSPCPAGLGGRGDDRFAKANLEVFDVGSSPAEEAWQASVPGEDLKHAPGTEGHDRFLREHTQEPDAEAELPHFPRVSPQSLGKDQQGFVGLERLNTVANGEPKAAPRVYGNVLHLAKEEVSEARKA